jgi:flagellar motor switch protein FliN
MAANTAEIFTTLVRVWASQFCEAWEGLCGSKPDVSVLPDASLLEAPLSEPIDLASGSRGQPQLVWYRFPFGTDSDTDLYVGSHRWERIGAVVLEAAGVETPSAADIQGTCLEMLNQAASGVSRILSKQAGFEILISSGNESSVAPESGSRFLVRFRILDQDQDVFLAGSENLSQLLVSLSAADKPAAITVRPAPAGRSQSMDLLLDVELPVSVSFGRAQLALKDVLKLTTGSIVELNRSVSEPVEVIVNNCVIARGEVVVVEGNFGVRIRQVVSRQERLKSLK